MCARIAKTFSKLDSVLHSMIFCGHINECMHSARNS